MDAPRKSRYAGVREQLDELADDIQNFLYRAFFYEVNHTYWFASGKQAPDTKAEVASAINEAFDFVLRRWESITDVRLILTASRDIFKATVLACIDVPRPDDAHTFLHRVHTNMFLLFSCQFYPRIENGMLPYAHSIEVIQRSWRRVNTDPGHLVCRRRLLREFEDLEGTVVC